MKPRLLPLPLAALALLLTSCQTHSGPASTHPRVPRQAHYDAAGDITGTTNVVGTRQYHYDKYGNRTGSTTTHKGRQYHYDQYGNLIGTSTLPKKGGR